MNENTEIAGLKHIVYTLTAPGCRVFVVCMVITATSVYDGLLSCDTHLKYGARLQISTYKKLCDFAVIQQVKIASQAVLLQQFSATSM